MLKLKNVKKLLRLNLIHKNTEQLFRFNNNQFQVYNFSYLISSTSQNLKKTIFSNSRNKSFSTSDNSNNNNYESNSQSNSHNTNFNKSLKNNSDENINPESNMYKSNSSRESAYSIEKENFKNSTLENNQNTNLIKLEQEENKGENSNQGIVSEKVQEKDLAPIDREALKQTTMKKLNESIPLEKISDETLREMIKYRVFEDSVAETVQKISKEVPEIASHDKFRAFIQEAIENDMQEELKNKEGLIILKKKSNPLIKYGIDYHHYRNYADRDYQVDIQEVLEKDLFEKQRVIDSYVEENKEKINEILGYYENKIKYTKFNKFSYLIYQNGYLLKMNKLRINFLKQIVSTGILSAALSIANPLYCLILIPEYISILYTMFVLNRTIDQIILTENKQSVKIRNFNFLGLRREIPGRNYAIANIRYFNKFENTVLNLNDKGFSFVTRLLWRMFKPQNKAVKNINENDTNKDNDGKSNKKEEQEDKAKKEQKKNIYSGNKNSENKEKENFNEANENNLNNKNSNKILDNFQTFHMITANGDVFYLPADLSQQHVDTNEELLLDILNNNYKKVLEFDYSEYQDRSTQFYEMVENWKKEYAKKTHEEYYTKEEKLQKEYSKYIGNRDFTEKNTQMTLKRTDGLDGTFIDNGYR